MNIEQRAHQAAIAHLSSIGISGSEDAAKAYQSVYEAIVEADMAASLARCGGYQKSLDDALYLDRIAQGGIMQSLSYELRMENNRLKDEIKAAKKRDPVMECTNIAVYGFIGFTLGIFLMWLK